MEALQGVATTIKVDIFSDFMCPYCYLGYASFLKALDKLDSKYSVDINYKYYKLHNEIPPNTTILQHYANKSNTSLEEVYKTEGKQIEALANRLGILIDFKVALLASTKDAHKLGILAKEQGLILEYYEYIFRSVFALGEDISQREFLLKVAKTLGIKNSCNAFKSEEYEKKLALSLESKSPISGIPTFFINNKKIVGVRDSNAFYNALIDR